jgi:hypothetical protein
MAGTDEILHGYVLDEPSLVSEIQGTTLGRRQRARDTSFSFSPANFQDAEETCPPGSSIEAFGGQGDAVRGIVGQTLNRHLGELVPHASPGLTSVQGSANWRKRLRDMMVKQNESILSFLTKPASEHTTFGPVETAMRRYAMRNDVDIRTIPTLKSLLDDSSTAAEFQKELSEKLAVAGPSNLCQLQAQNKMLLDIYKEIGDKLVEVENQLKLRLEKMDKLQSRVALLMDLHTNPALPQVVDSLEKYLEVEFTDFQIESFYKQLLTLHQKHIHLRDAIQILRTGASTSADPMCTICLQDSISYVHIPCGHTFCSTCSRRQSLTCYVCRGTTRERVKLYLS